MNKISIMNKLISSKENVLIRLAEWKYDENYLKHQIGFLAQNLLDNSCNYKHSIKKTKLINNHSFKSYSS